MLGKEVFSPTDKILYKRMQKSTVNAIHGDGLDDVETAMSKLLCC